MKEHDLDSTIRLEEEDVPVVVIETLIFNLEKLVENQPNVVRQLYSFAARNIPLSTESAQVLRSHGILEDNGTLHDMTRAVVRKIITFDMGQPVLVDILNKQEDNTPNNAIQTAVDSLSKQETMALNISMMLGHFGSQVMGYDKIVHLLVDGQPTTELRAAIKSAFIANTR